MHYFHTVNERYSELFHDVCALYASLHVLPLSPSLSPSSTVSNDQYNSNSKTKINLAYSPMPNDSANKAQIDYHFSINFSSFSSLQFEQFTKCHIDYIRYGKIHRFFISFHFIHRTESGAHNSYTHKHKKNAVKFIAVTKNEESGRFSVAVVFFLFSLSFISLVFCSFFSRCVRREKFLLFQIIV